MRRLKPARFWALIRSLFTRTFEATLPGGARVNVWPREQVVLPVIAGAAEDGDSADDNGDSGSADDSAADSNDSSADDSGDASSDDDSANDSSDDTADGDSEVEKLRAELRKHRGTERRAKRSEAKTKELEAKLKNKEDEKKSEHEKALEKAREEGEKTALTKAEKDRQADRLEVAVTRIAAKAIKVGEGDDAKNIKFADSEDALVYLNRAISAGDLDSEDVFGDDGKVNTESVTEALREILESKPHLGEDSKPHKPSGDADAGKGKGSGAKELEDMSPEELYKRSKR